MTDTSKVGLIGMICIVILMIVIAIVTIRVNDTIQTKNIICDSYWNSTTKYKSEWISNDNFGNYKYRNGLYEYTVRYELKHLQEEK